MRFEPLTSERPDRRCHLEPSGFAHGDRVDEMEVDQRLESVDRVDQRSTAQVHDRVEIEGPRQAGEDAQEALLVGASTS